MFPNYDGVLKVDGEVGVKKTYDPRTYLKAGRGRHGRAGRPGLREPALDGHHAALTHSRERGSRVRARAAHCTT